MRRFTAIASRESAATEARRRNPPMTTTASGELPAGWPRMSLAQAHAALTAPGSPFELETVAIDGREMRVFKHAPPTLREVFLAGRSHGTKDFLVYRDERVDYEAFSRASVTLANALVARGLRKGDRVAIAMRNLPEWPVALFGTLLAGGIATLLNAWWTGPELEYGLTDSGSRFAFVDGERLERLAPHRAACVALEHLWVSREAPGMLGPGVESLSGLIGPSADWAGLPVQPMPDVALAPDDGATILYTSGTTGRSKGALGTHRNAACALMAGPFTAVRNFVRRGEPVPVPDPTAPQRCTLLSIPFFHTTGCHAVLCPTIANGAKLVLMHHWDPLEAMRLIQDERVTSAGGVPTIAWQLIEHPERERFDLSSLESVAYGGAPAASELVRRIKDVFPASAPGIGWGMTETTSTFTGHSAEDYQFRPDSSGPCLPIGDAKVIDDAGNELPAGAVGELCVRGPNVVRGYWGKPEATAETFVDGWLRTGDLARLDDEGFVFIVDRKKDMLIRGGENIYCSEVEAVLFEHPGVMDAAVIGLAHHTLGEEPAAVVTLKAGAQATEQELRAFVAARLASFKVPVRIAFSGQTLPRNANGKIMKLELKGFFAT